MQKENDEKDLKYSNILRELEIKDTTIFSLESMLIRKDEEIHKLKDSHKLFTNNYNNNSQFNNNNNTYEEGFNNTNNNYDNNRYFNNQNEEENYLRASNNFPKGNFNKDIDNENELKNLIKGNNNHYRKKSDSSNFSKDNTQYDSNLGNFNSKKLYDSNTSMKIPGRIVSLKKK